MPKKLLIAVTITGILLRIVPIWARLTWYDENFTIILARLPLADLLTATAGDVHPPLWYLLCWPLAHLGLPGWAICRLPALAASLASLYVWWLVLKEMELSPRVREWAFVLFALLPTQVYYAQEGRQYALLTLLVLLAWLCILRWNWVGLMFAAVAMLYLHNYGLFYATALWIAGMIRRPRDWPGLTLALSSAGALFMPWLMVLLSQMTTIKGNYWMVHISPVSVMSDLAHSFWNYDSSFANILFDFGLFWGLLGFALYRSIRTRTLSLPITALAFVPWLLAIVASLLWQPVMLHRALVPSGVFIALLIAMQADWISQQRRRILLAAIFILPALLVNLCSVTFRYRTLLSDNILLATIAANWQDGDLIYHNDDGFFVGGAAWELFTPEMDILRIPTCGPTLGGLTPATRLAIGQRSGLLTEYQPRRIWVVMVLSPLHSECNRAFFSGLGLLKSPPLTCTRNDELVSACVYLVTP